MPKGNSVISKIEVYPEQWGAIGDGEADDRAAFQAMFDELKTAPYCRKVVLRPANYYAIKSALDETNVFEIKVQNLILEGPGMARKVFAYEGDNPVTNFFHFECLPGEEAYNRLIELNIVGHKTKLRNIINFNNTNFSSLERCHFQACSGSCVSGFNWCTEVRHCEFQDAEVGLGSIFTTAFVANCYAVGCTEGFRISGTYGSYMGCACDHAEIAYHVVSTGMGNNTLLAGCGCEDANQAIVACGMISVQGFSGFGRENPASPYFLDFYDAAGVIQGITIGTNSEWWIRYQAGGGYPTGPFMIGPEIPRNKICGFMSEEAEPRRLAWDAGGYHYNNYAPADFKELARYTFSAWEAKQSFYAIFNASDEQTFVETVKLGRMSGYGVFTFWSESLGNVIINLSQQSGNAFEIIDARIPVVFHNMHFKQSGTGALFQIRNCSLVKFEGCKFETTMEETICLDIDTLSNIEIDKATMDNMTKSGPGSWARLFYGPCEWPNFRMPIRFTGHSAVPTLGKFDPGCRIEYFSPGPGSYAGAICTTGGEPGTWKEYGEIES